MKCPNCFGSFHKIDASYHDSTESIIRKRHCKHCDHCWHTCEVELPRTAFRWVEKKNLQRLPAFQKIKFTA